MTKATPSPTIILKRQWKLVQCAAKLAPKRSLATIVKRAKALGVEVTIGADGSMNSTPRMWRSRLPHMRAMVLISIASWRNSKPAMVKRDVKGNTRSPPGGGFIYAWRGGPRLRGEEGRRNSGRRTTRQSQGRRIPEAGRFRSLVTLSRASPDYTKLAPATKENWGPWLDRIAEYFDSHHCRSSSGPRNPARHPQVAQSICRPATHRRCCLAVFARALPCRRSARHARGQSLRGHQATGTSRTAPKYLDRSRYRPHQADLLSGDRMGYRSRPTRGLRKADLLRLSWSHIGDDAIVITTAKSGHKREAIMPLYDALKAVLASIPKRSTYRC